MANSVTFPTALGGDGSTVTDDADPTTGLANGGHRLRFVPALSQAVIMSQTAASKAAAAAADRQQTGEDRTAVAADKTAAQEARSGAEALYGDLDAVNQAKTAAQDYAGQAGDSAAEAAADAATADQHRIDAEAARDAANVAGQVYADTAAGLAATSDGDHFKTPAASTEGFLTLYRNDGGVADPIDTFPSLNGVAAAVAKINDQQTRLTRSLAAVGDHGQSLHSDFAIGAYALGNRAGLNRSVSDAEMWTCNRASPGATYDENGVLGEAGIDELRYGYDFETGRRYLLAEPRRTNQFLHSNHLGGEFWIDQSASSVANATNSPGNSVDAIKVVLDSGVASQSRVGRYNEGYYGFEYGRPMCFSCFVKADEFSVVCLYNDVGTAQGAKTTFDLNTGSVVSQTYHPNIPVSDGRIEDVGGGWFRVSHVVVQYRQEGERAIASSIFGIESAETNGADGTSGIYAWGAQLEDGTFPTSYIPTAGSTVTRSGDSVSRKLGDEFSPDKVTLVLRGTLLGLSGGYSTLLGLSAQGSGAGVVNIRISDSGALRLNDGSGAQTIIGDVDPGDDIVVAFSIDAKAGVSSAHFNGTSIDIGSGGSSGESTLQFFAQALTGVAREVQYFPEYYDAAGLDALLL